VGKRASQDASKPHDFVRRWPLFQSGFSLELSILVAGGKGTRWWFPYEGGEAPSLHPPSPFLKGLLGFGRVDKGGEGALIFFLRKRLGGKLPYWLFCWSVHSSIRK